jgi:hypothetical protein
MWRGRAKALNYVCEEVGLRPQFLGVAYLPHFFELGIDLGPSDMDSCFRRNDNYRTTWTVYETIGFDEDIEKTGPDL